MYNIIIIIIIIRRKKNIENFKNLYWITIKETLFLSLHTNMSLASANPRMFSDICA